jgi:hypothetical protein
MFVSLTGSPLIASIDASLIKIIGRVCGEGLLLPVTDRIWKARELIVAEGKG